MLKTILKNFPIKISAFNSFYNKDNYSINREHEPFSFVLRKRIVFNDGHSFSVQASASSYCEPRISNDTKYTKAEIGFPSFESNLLKPYAEDENGLKETVYPYTPMELIIYIILEHDGIKEWK